MKISNDDFERLVETIKQIEIKTLQNEVRCLDGLVLDSISVIFQYMDEEYINLFCKEVEKSCKLWKNTIPYHNW